MQIYQNAAVTRGAPIASFFFDRDTTSSRPDYNTRIYRPLARFVIKGTGKFGGDGRKMALDVSHAIVHGLARTPPGLGWSIFSADVGGRRHEVEGARHGGWGRAGV